MELCSSQSHLGIHHYVLLLFSFFQAFCFGISTCWKLRFWNWAPAKEMLEFSLKQTMR